jgi:vacuolar iron transporter family protein
MNALEFGIVDDEIRSPVAAALISCFLFLVGSTPTILPFVVVSFAFGGDGTVKDGILGATAFTIIALLVVGTVKSGATCKNCLTSAFENLFIAGVGGLNDFFTRKLLGDYNT